jgi:hypothetical protein
VGHLCLRKLILFDEHALKGPEAQLLDVPQLPLPVEEVLDVLAHNGLAGELPQQLHEQRQMILVPAHITTPISDKYIGVGCHHALVLQEYGPPHTHPLFEQQIMRHPPQKSSVGRLCFGRA